MEDQRAASAASNRGRDAPRAQQHALCPQIRDLALIGDRRTCAVVGRDGTIGWYCPERFDRPSLFAGLLDEGGGFWTVEVPCPGPGSRRYLGGSGVLETSLGSQDGDLLVTDWMNAGGDAPGGVLCRRFAAAPADVRIVLTPRPDYARRQVELNDVGVAVEINGRYRVHASHALRVEEDDIVLVLPKGEEGWVVLADGKLAKPTGEDLGRWLSATLEHWRTVSAHGSYSGPYERDVAASLRAIRLLTHEETGGIVAAATTSLPEVVGGSANWDYRYVWLRDAGMIVSALTRLGSDLSDGERYLDFICGSRESSSRYPMAVFTTLDGQAAPGEEVLPFAGYEGSRPVRIGNGAGEQMQLDAFANVLLAAKLIYEASGERPHWETVEQIAEFLVEHWREPDHGIWEETAKLQYTSSKVVVACGLHSIAEFSSDDAQAERWRAAVREIRSFVSENCLTSTGAYAVAAGSEEVDVSAALFPVWAYTSADTPEMRATMDALERDWSWNGLLYRRRLECADAHEEGAFLAGTFWVAQYWIMRDDLDRACRILDAGLACANDLGLFSEEADPVGGRMLGNFPQSFVHAAFIGTVLDLKAALQARHQASEE